MDYMLEFERPIHELEGQIKELREMGERPNIDLTKEINALETKVNQLIQDIYKNLTPWERVQLCRHPMRPHAVEYIENVFTDFKELHGDRRFSDDPAMIVGTAFLDEKPVVVIGIDKGRNTQERIKRNFGMPRPEGYRKALRVMQMADQFQIPIITFVDTPGAYPGIEAEERGQAQAIAENLMEMFGIKSPIVSVVIGEGGSGGALGIAVSDKVLMLEYSVYSVISPESCASILWSDPRKAEEAANSLQLSPQKALELKVIDGIIEEPIGGAHRSMERAVQLVKRALVKELTQLLKVDTETRKEQRYAKFRAMGNHSLHQASEKKGE